MTERVLAAIENPLVDCIGHLTGRLIGRREPYGDRRRGGRRGGGPHRHDDRDQRQPEPPRPLRAPRPPRRRGRGEDRPQHRRPRRRHPRQHGLRRRHRPPRLAHRRRRRQHPRLERVQEAAEAAEASSARAASTATASSCSKAGAIASIAPRAQPLRLLPPAAMVEVASPTSFKICKALSLVEPELSGHPEQRLDPGFGLMEVDRGVQVAGPGLRIRVQVERRRERPAGGGESQETVVAQVIVGVRDQDREGDAAPELGQVVAGGGRTGFDRRRRFPGSCPESPSEASSIVIALT